MDHFKKLLIVAAVALGLAAPAVALPPPTTGYNSLTYTIAKGTATLQIAGDICVGKSSMTLSTCRARLNGTDDPSLPSLRLSSGIKLDAGGIRWADGSYSTTAAQGVGGGGGEANTYTSSKTFTATSDTEFTVDSASGIIVRAGGIAFPNGKVQVTAAIPLGDDGSSIGQSIQYNNGGVLGGDTGLVYGQPNDHSLYMFGTINQGPTFSLGRFFDGTFHANEGVFAISSLNSRYIPNSEDGDVQVAASTGALLLSSNGSDGYAAIKISTGNEYVLVRSTTLDVRGTIISNSSTTASAFFGTYFNSDGSPFSGGGGGGSYISKTIIEIAATDQTISDGACDSGAGSYGVAITGAGGNFETIAGGTLTFHLGLIVGNTVLNTPCYLCGQLNGQLVGINYGVMAQFSLPTPFTFLPVAAELSIVNMSTGTQNFQVYGGQGAGAGCTFARAGTQLRLEQTK